MSPAVLHRYEVYRMANLPGLTVQEMEPESRAATEIASLWDWLSTSAIVHNGAGQHDDDEQEERGVPCGA
jgi:chromosome partitioning protein